MIASLVDRIEKARRTYYNGTGELTLSDAAYDAIEDELRTLDPNHPVLAKVGAPAPSSGAWVKVKHRIPMSSLNKAQVEADMDSWFGACGVLAGGARLTIMDKLDGLSVALRYEKRRLVQALTRGDGSIGEDITRNVLLMKGALKMLPPTLGGAPTPDEVDVRGEIVCLRSDFATHFRGESNPRNTASGTAKRQSDPSKCAHLTIIAYQLLPNGVAMANKQAELVNLQDMGFKTPLWTSTFLPSGVMSTYQDYVTARRASLDYEIDGLVIDIDDLNHREALGDLNGRPKGSIAFKFPHEAKPTTLRAIRWQVGNSGRITPVAEFDTVPLAGANVSQASLHNLSNIAEIVDQARPGQTLLLTGDQIVVSRRNDVIPYVESVIGGGTTPLDVPTHCPSCSGPLTRDGEYLVCRSEECPAQATGSLKRWCKKIGVLHVGDTLIEAMVDAFPFILTDSEFEARFGVTKLGYMKLPLAEQEVIKATPMDIADLYTLDVDAVANMDIGGRRVGGTADKAITNLMAKMTLPLHILVGSVGIPQIGRDGAKTIIDAGYNSLSLMLKAKVSSPLPQANGTTLPAVANIPGVGDTKARAFVDGFLAKAGLISKLLGNGIQIQAVSGALVGMSFCLTGFRDQALSDAIEKVGGTMKSSVSKGLTYLIAQDPTSTSGKAQQARKYGTRVIGIDEARKLAGI